MMDIDGDEMQLGDTGLVPQGKWLVEKATGNRIDPEGVIFDSENNLIFDPNAYDEEEDR